jgi:hypothetical protein
MDARLGTGRRHRRAPAKKRRRWPWIVSALTVVGIIIVVATTVTGKKATNAGKTTTGSAVLTTSAAAVATTAAPTAASTTAAAAAKAHLGSTISLKSGAGYPEQLDVTLVQVQDNAPASNQYSAPDPGKKYYAIQYRLQNTGSQAYYDSPSNGAVVIDSQSQLYPATYADTAAGPSFPGSISIPPGGMALGWLTFQVPTTAVIASAQFRLQSGAGAFGQWIIP